MSLNKLNTLTVSGEKKKKKSYYAPQIKKLESIVKMTAGTGNANQYDQFTGQSDIS